MHDCTHSASCRSDPLLNDLGKQDSHHFECHLVSRLPQVLLLHCVPLHPRWLHQCHPTCQQWHLPHSDLPPTWHHLQDWGGGCEEGRRSRQTEGKGHAELHDWRWRWEMMMEGRHGVVLYTFIHPSTHGIVLSKAWCCLQLHPLYSNCYSPSTIINNLYSLLISIPFSSVKPLW